MRLWCCLCERRWTGPGGLLLDLASDDGGISGTARLTLSNGVVHSLLANGRATVTGPAELALTGDPADPAAKGILLRLAITPLQGGQARVEGLEGRAYGQSLGR